jgi:hypothetical protein
MTEDDLVISLRQQMETDRFKHDPAAVRDVIRIVRAVLAADTADS